MRMLQRLVIFGSMAALAVMGLVGGRYLLQRSRRTPPPPRPEVTLTIIPGWNLRQVAAYLVAQGFASSTPEVYRLVGEPAAILKPSQEPPDWLGIFVDPLTHNPLFPLLSNKPPLLSYEGFIFPDTYRVYADASLQQILKKIFTNLEQHISFKLALDRYGGDHSWYQVLTMASIIEKETRHDQDRALVADILWRRIAKGWALQVDSSVHYAVGKTGDVFTSDAERAVESPWNTYKYPGLPPGPICNPSSDSIEAVVHPQANDYWYFLSGTDGAMHYARTLEEHNRNRVKYLR